MSHDEAAILSMLLNYDIMREEETKPSKDYRMLCVRMNDFNIEEKEKCISCGSAMNAFDGSKFTEKTKNDIRDWLCGEKTFLEVFETTLLRYEFSLT